MKAANTVVAAPSSPSLTEAVEAALDENRRRWESARSEHRFLDPAWEFVRLLLAIPEFAELDRDAGRAADLAESCVPNVWSRLPSETSLGDPVDPVESFLSGWDAVVVADGAPSALRLRIEDAWLGVCAQPPDSEAYGPELAHYGYRLFRPFLALLERLQVEYGSDPFPLPQEVTAEVMSTLGDGSSRVDQTQVSRWVGMARRFGHLVPESKCNRKKRRCAEYRFVVPSQICESGTREVRESTSQRVRQSRESGESVTTPDDGVDV